MKESTFEYSDAEQSYEGFAITQGDEPRASVIVCHAWGGIGDYEKDKARGIAQLGYNVFAVDVYGKGKRGTTVAENQALMTPLVENRALLRQRLQTSLDAVRAQAGVDSKKIAALGYCFGGLCVLDLARSGANIKGVVSIHGLFDAPADLSNELIKAKVLALHGYEDPMVPPEKVTELAQELTEAGVDWQIHAYGLTYHAFTNPAANDAGMGTVFNEAANRRTDNSVKDFLQELFD